MKECDIFRGSKHTLVPPTYFQGMSRPPTPRIDTAEHPVLAVNWAKRLHTLWDDDLLAESAAGSTHFTTHRTHLVVTNLIINYISAPRCERFWHFCTQNVCVW